ncbi:MAG TPA: outer membrane protein assembly factor BamC [Burkholderiaceae bacterium]|nr:outer membrane protein assembly factor BamC [Burkholderiaceae bacterium]
MTFPHSVRLLCLSIALVLAGCGSYDQLVNGDSVDYRTQGNKTAPLDVPPDLTQLSRDPRYAPQGAAVSANALQNSAPAPALGGGAKTKEVAVNDIEGTRIERLGTDRWLYTPLPPDQLWPQLRTFWQERGLALTVDLPEAGVMETDWAENRAKIPQDIIRGTIGKVFDSAYSTGERDKFRTRVERNPTGGSDVFITMRRMVEVYNTQDKTNTVWQPAPDDPQMEAEMLGRLLLKLTAKPLPQAASASAPTNAAALVTNVPPPPPRAHMVEGAATPTLQVDDGFDRAWRRVGIALDRTGFTVEDRDRAQGIYFVRYVDPKTAGQAEPNFFTKLFTSGSNPAIKPVRYRVTVKSDGKVSLVTVLGAEGMAADGEAVQSILAMLLNELK